MQNPHTQSSSVQSPIVPLCCPLGLHSVNIDMAFHAHPNVTLQETQCSAEFKPSKVLKHFYSKEQNLASFQILMRIPFQHYLVYVKKQKIYLKFTAFTWALRALSKTITITLFLPVGLTHRLCVASVRKKRLKRTKANKKWSQNYIPVLPYETPHKNGPCPTLRQNLGPTFCEAVAITSAPPHHPVSCSIETILYTS